MSLDLNGGIRKVNISFSKLTGYSNEEIIKSGPTGKIKNYANLAFRLRSIETQGDLFEMHLQIKHKDGTEASYLCNAVGVGEDGYLIFITERAPSILRGQNHSTIAINQDPRVYEIAEATSDFIGIADSQGKALFLNKALRDLKGIKGSDYYHLEITDFHPPASNKKLFEEAIPHSIQHGIWKGETEIYDKFGNIIPVSQICLAHKNENGEVEYISTIIRDISEIKKAELELAQSRKKLAQAQKIAQLGHWELDLKTGTLTGSDEIFARLNLKQNVSNFKDFLEFVHPSDRKNVKEVSQKALVDGENYSIEYRVRRSDGEERWILTLGQGEKNHEGEMVKLTGTFQDITRSKQTEEKLLASNEELEMFFYRTSHDLKSPLASARGLINLARGTDNFDEIKYYLDIISTSLGKLDGILTDLIEVTRVRRGEVEFYPVDPRQVIYSVCEAYNEYNTGEVTLIDEIEIDKLETDYSYFNIILRNLISNCIKYRSKERNPYIKVRMFRRDKNICLEVEDNGIGIRTSALPGIFEMFFRGTDEQETGAGLGLFIVKNAVERLKGAIEVKSEWKKGTTFLLSFPICPETKE